MKKTVVKVTIELMDKMLGTVPKDPEIYKTYIASKAAEVEPVEAQDIQKVEEKGWTGFFKDEEKGVYILNYMITGFLKEAANNLKEQFRITNFRNKVGNFVFTEPRQIYFGKMDVDGVLERPLRGQTAQGPIVSLARSEYINEGNTLNFQLVILDNKEFKADTIKELFEYGEYKGLGQFRNGSYGRFKLISWEEVK